LVSFEFDFQGVVYQVFATVIGPFFRLAFHHIHARKILWVSQLFCIWFNFEESKLVGYMEVRISASGLRGIFTHCANDTKRL
jgi:hypothetical protein